MERQKRTKLVDPYKPQNAGEVKRRFSRSPAINDDDGHADADGESLTNAHRQRRRRSSKRQSSGSRGCRFREQESENSGRPTSPAIHGYNLRHQGSFPSTPQGPNTGFIPTPEDLRQRERPGSARLGYARGETRSEQDEPYSEFYAKIVEPKQNEAMLSKRRKISGQRASTKREKNDADQSHSLKMPSGGSLALKPITSKDDLTGIAKNPHFDQNSKSSLKVQKVASREDLLAYPKEDDDRGSLMLKKIESKDDVEGDAKNPKIDDESSSLRLKEVSSLLDQDGNHKMERRRRSRRSTRSKIRRSPSPSFSPPYAYPEREGRVTERGFRIRSPRSESRGQAYSSQRTSGRRTERTGEYLDRGMAGEEEESVDERMVEPAVRRRRGSAPLPLRNVEPRRATRTKLIRPVERKEHRTQSNITLQSEGGQPQNRYAAEPDEVSEGDRYPLDMPDTSRQTRARTRAVRSNPVRTIRQIAKLRADLEADLFRGILDEAVIRQFLDRGGVSSQTSTQAAQVGLHDDTRAKAKFIHQVASLARGIDKHDDIGQQHILFAVWCHEHKLHLNDQKYEAVYAFYKQHILC